MVSSKKLFFTNVDGPHKIQVAHEMEIISNEWKKPVLPCNKRKNPTITGSNAKTRRCFILPEDKTLDFRFLRIGGNSNPQKLTQLTSDTV